MRANAPLWRFLWPSDCILFLAANSSIRRKPVFRNVDDIHIVGIFPNYESAHNAWKAEAQRTVDNAHMRYFIAHLHRLRDEEAAASSTEELGA